MRHTNHHKCDCAVNEGSGAVALPTFSDMHIHGQIAHALNTDNRAELDTLSPVLPCAMTGIYRE